MKGNALKVLTAVSILVLAVTCSVNVQAAKLKLNRKKIVLSINESFKLRAKGSKKAKVKWSSSAPRIAKVNKNGKVTGKRAGKAVITAKAGRKKLKCKVTVEKPCINKTTLRLNKGDSYKLKMKGTRRKVKWSVKNSKIAGITKESRENQNLWKGRREKVFLQVDCCRYKTCCS